MSIRHIPGSSRPPLKRAEAIATTIRTSTQSTSRSRKASPESLDRGAVRASACAEGRWTRCLLACPLLGAYRSTRPKADACQDKAIGILALRIFGGLEEVDPRILVRLIRHFLRASERASFLHNPAWAGAESASFENSRARSTAMATRPTRREVVRSTRGRLGSCSGSARRHQGSH